MESFVEVARHKSFTKAAEKLHITQSTMSARIQKLETELGVPLFLRLSKSVSLSNHGEILLPYAQDCINKIGTGIKKIEEERRKNISKLSICSTVPFGVLIMPFILPALYDFGPFMNIQLVRNVNQSDEVLEMLIDARIDIGIVDYREYLDHAEYLDVLELVPLYEDDYVVLASTSHELANCSSMSFTQLSEYGFILSDNNDPLSKHIQSYFEEHEIKATGNMVVNSFPGILEMVKKRNMVTILPRLLASRYAKNGDVIEIRLEPPLSPQRTFLAYSRNYNERKLVKYIVAKVAEVIEEHKLPCRMILR